MLYYLYLPGGFPEWARHDNVDAVQRLKPHPRLGVYADVQSLLEAYDRAKREALNRISRNGRPNLDPDTVRRLTRVHLHLVVSSRPR